MTMTYTNHLNLKKLEIAANQKVKEKNFWITNLCDAPGKSVFPYDYARFKSGPVFEKIEFEFSRELFSKLEAAGSGSNPKVFMILAAGLVTLLHMYTGENDIIVGSPIFKRRDGGESINNALILRNRLDEDMTFKELLLQVKQTILEAMENQNYPIVLLPMQLQLNWAVSHSDDFPLFDVSILLENIHDKNDLRYLNHNMQVSFLRTAEGVKGVVTYNSQLYAAVTVDRLVRHLLRLLEAVLFNMGLRLSSIDILVEEGKKQVLVDFNHTRTTYPKGKPVHELFEKQVERTPDSIAVVGSENQNRETVRNVVQLTYKELDQESDQLAHVLKEKGVEPDTIVGIMIERSPEMIIGILGILKTGGAYLPIDTDYPEERIATMLTDSNAKILVSEVSKVSTLSGGLDVVKPSELSQEHPTHLTHLTHPTQLCYIIYTSGSTGRPKGVMVEHRNLLAYIHAFYREFEISANDTALQQASLAFDAFVEEAYPVLLRGGKIVIPSSEEILDIDLLLEFICKNGVTLISCSPLMLNELNRLNGLDTIHVHTFISGGDVLKKDHVDRLLKIGKVYNTYGPTETTVCVSYYKYKRSDSPQISIPIGKPISNYKVYILAKEDMLMPVGVPGEICIAGDGVSRGYLNRVELTAEKFLSISYKSYRSYKTYISKKIYRTGDLGRWLPDGNIEFLGRIDHQVKIRGFRIELGEIESQLLNHAEIKDSVVVVRMDEEWEKYLCAYIVSDSEPTISELRGYLSRVLPDYMIPSYFVQIDRVPLTPNGKVDRKALPDPEIRSDKEYMPPTNKIEEKLVEIWSEILKLPVSLELHESIGIGIHDNFFELGGHSLKAVTLLSMVHKEFSVRIPLAKLFKTPTIRELSYYIEETAEDKLVTIKPVEMKEYYTLSSAQKRLYILHQIDPESIGYNMPGVIPLAVEPDIQKLKSTFIGLIKRHESLRTSFKMVDEEPVQRVHPDVGFELEYFGLEPGQVSGMSVDTMVSNFVRPFDLSQAPLLRVGMVKTVKGEELLFVDMHHIISDGISHDVLLQDFILLDRDEKLMPLRIQYKDYAQWQNRLEQRKAIEPQENYWLKEFAGDIAVLDLPGDYARPALQSFEGNTLRFEIGGEESFILRRLALDAGATFYMVLLAVCNVFLSKLSNQEDIVIGTPVAGRRHADLQKIIGMFVNTLALRNYPASDKSFKGFVEEVKRRAVEAFDNQEYQFEDLVEKVEVNRDASRNPLFDIMFLFQENREFPGVSDSDSDSNSDRVDGTDAVVREGAELAGIAKFDLTIAGMDVGDRLHFSFQYCTKLFKTETIERFIAIFRKIVSVIVKDPGMKLREIEITAEEEKNRLLYDFNDTGAEYSRDKTIHELFEDQVERTPERIAIVGSGHSVQGTVRGPEEGPARYAVRCALRHALTYRELDEKSNCLAVLLKEKGVGPGTIVGIMVERSLEMIIGIFAILKAGGAYLPIEPGYPEKRVTYILGDSAAPLLLTRSAYREGIPSGCETVELGDGGLYSGEKHTPVPINVNAPHDPVYTIYTSGSTGKPKGVVIEHGPVVNILSCLFKRYPFFERDTYLFKTSYVFDVSVSEIFGWFWGGGRLAILEAEAEKDPERIIEVIEEMTVSHINFVPSMFTVFVDFLNRQNIVRLWGLRYIFLAGEALSPVIVNKFRELGSRIRLENIYGPTECTIYATRYSLACWDGVGSIPIGHPLMNLKAYILDSYGGLQPIGIAGELCLAGLGLARGYLNRPELTAEKFDHDLWDFRDYHDDKKENYQKFFGGSRGAILQKSPPGRRRLYKTGDLARWLADGNIEFLGRFDQQIKIRGFRIELGEIENVLLSHHKIKEAVVTAGGDGSGGAPGGSGDKHLCAYIVAVGKFDNARAQLKEYLSGLLPDYMIPAYFTELEKIPLTPSGKIDRNALPLPVVKGEAEYTAPGDEIEVKLVEIWSHVLGSPAVGTGELTIGIDDNFFGLGGHSLKATFMAAKIHKELNVKVPLAEVFKAPTIRGLAQYIRGAAIEGYASIEPVEKKEYYALSSPQKRLYILQQMEPDNISYNIPQIIPLPGNIDKSRVEGTFKRLISRHESLRTSFEVIDETPVQKVYDEVPLSIDCPETDEKEVNNIIKGFTRPFELSQAPLLRVGLIKIESLSQLLLVDMHHIITDGTSQNILREEFMALSSGEDLPPLRLQYKDYCRWHNSEEQQSLIKHQETYWLNVFSDELPILNLPMDYPRPLIQSFQGGFVSFALTEKETHTLKRLARETKSTLYMSTLSVFNILLSKLSGQEDIFVGTPVEARRHADLSPIIGMFVNTLALRNFPSSEKRVLDFFKEVRERSLDAFENQEYQFEDLVDRVPVRRDTSRNPIFDVMFNLLNQQEYKGETLEIDDRSPHEHRESISKFDMNWTAVDMGKRLFIAFEYCSKLFKSDTIERIIAYFKKILHLLSENTDQKLSEIEIISEKEKEQILFEFNDTKVKYLKDKTIHELFEQQVEKRPDNMAVVYEDKQLTYKELNEKINQLARILTSKGVGADTIVSVMVERSIEMLVGVLGILKSGGAYLPISPEDPEDRLSHVLDDSGTKLLLSETGLVDIQADRYRYEVIDLGDADLYHGESENLEKIVSASSDLAYVIYTSGSTGRPKGVTVEHKSATNILLALNRNYAFEESSVCLLKTSYVFDVSVSELFGWFLGGGTLAILERHGEKDPYKMLDKIEKANISHINFVPSAFNVFVESLSRENIGKLSSLKYIFLAGEALLPYLVEKFVRLDSKVILENLYGPTEAAIYASEYSLSAWRGEGNIPIGKPLQNVKLYVFDRDDCLQAIGVPGELCISGAGLARGYLNRPVLTLEQFVENRYVEGERIYKSKDLARWLPDGNIEFLGRIDNQVKIRGYRIELGEIESQLLRHEEIEDAVVIAWGEGEEKYLCGYIVPASVHSQITSELREYLSKQLPDYMIPSYFVQLERIPLTVSGKVDCKALTKPEVEAGSEYTAPGDEIEEKLVEIWSGILGIKADIIGIYANFFELGGHSLKATGLVIRIQKELNIDLPLLKVFRSPTIKQLAAYIRDAKKGTVVRDENLLLLREKCNSNNHLFFVHDGTGEVEGYIEFFNHLNNEFNCWGIRADRLKDYTPQNLTIENIAERYIEKIRKVQSHGPFYIAGWSLGGTIAFEMIKQLEQNKEGIAFLGLIDSPTPHKRSRQDAGEFGEFNLESESRFIESYLKDIKIKEELRNIEKIELFWPTIVDYLEAGDFDVELIKKIIQKYGMQALPNYSQLNLRESIYYLNVGRTLANARALYIPVDSIHTTLHYFKASQSKEIINESWDEYCRRPIKFYEVPGNHYSIFKAPGVVELARQFDGVLISLKNNKNKRRVK